jgi:phenylalanyl-tRNA synthetase beta chain
MALAWTGAATPRHWSHPARDVDFFDVKGVVEQVCRALEVDATFEAAGLPWFVAGQTASVLAAGAAVGCLGRLTPSVLERRGVPRQDQDPVFAAELSLDALSAARVAGDDAVRALPRHPSVVRDVSIVVDDALPAAIIRGTIQAAGAGAPAPLAGLDVFDRYRGEGVPEGRVSLSLRLTFQAADRTLTDAEVQPSVDAILAALVSRHGAVQR